MQRGFVERLLYVDVDCARDVTQLGRDFLRDCKVSVGVDAGDGDIDRRGRSEVQNLRDNVGGLEEKLNARESFWQLRAHFIDVVGGGSVFFIELDQNFAVGS